jgi:hypothetical protein
MQKVRAPGRIHVDGQEVPQGGVLGDDGVCLWRADVHHIAECLVPSFKALAAQWVASEGRLHAGRALSAASKLVQEGVLRGHALYHSPAAPCTGFL